jgi:Ni/Fe-hydrogenase subunit HybB-like protein
MSAFAQTPDLDRRPGTGLGQFLMQALRPRGRLITVFNVISIPVILLGVVLLVVRFAFGLGSITNLSQDYPWGLWIGFDVITGVAFAGGAYVLCFMVYVLRMEKYHPIIRVTVLNGLLAYIFYAGALLLDLGRPWNVINPIIGKSFGVSSVLFLVAWHFLLYMAAEAIEFSPAIAEWLGWRRIRRILGALTLGAVIFGITLSTLHQSGLGALYLMAKGKVHPQGTISRRVFRSQLGSESEHSHDDIVFGLARICAGAMFVYLFLQAMVFVHGQRWSHLGTGMGAWYLVEILGFVVAPCALLVVSAQRRRLSLVRVAAVMILVGIVLNRLNVSIIAFRWDAPVRYVPTWMEIEVTLAIIFAEIWAFRWIVNRMPVLRPAPAWARRGLRTESARKIDRRPGEVSPWKAAS